MKGLSLKPKGRLFAAFVLSVLLYNSEVWVIGKREMEDLEGKVVYLMKLVETKGGLSSKLRSSGGAGSEGEDTVSE